MNADSTHGPGGNFSNWQGGGGGKPGVNFSNQRKKKKKKAELISAIGTKKKNK